MIVHIAFISPFLPDYYELIKNYFDSKEHYFLIVDRKKTSFSLNIENLIWVDSKLKLPSLLYYILKADKIILHCIGSKNAARLIEILPGAIKKTYWVMWGAEFYFPESQPKWRKKFISKLRHCVTFLEGDYRYAVKNYNMRAEMLECVMYPNAFLPEVKISEEEIAQLRRKDNDRYRILMGNSAAKTNNHFEAFEAIEKFKRQNIEIVCPLSYGGDKDYIEQVISRGKDLFGDKFVPIVEFMKFDNYAALLRSVDIGVFAYDRQQGLGNIGLLIKFGKKVFLKSGNSQYDFYRSKNILIEDFKKIRELNFEEFVNFADDIAIKNKNNFENYFSIENCVEQWKKVFEREE